MLQRFGHIIPNPGFDEAERKFIAIMVDNEVGCPALLSSVGPCYFPISSAAHPNVILITTQGYLLGILLAE